MIKVMIVDDMPIFLEYLRESIDWAAYGFELVCEASNGQEAYEKALIYQPDIVLSDIMMPYEDGLTLTDRLKRQNPQIAVVLITGNSEFEYARRAIKLGVQDYIVKPFEKEELLLTLLNLQDNFNKAIEHKVAREDEHMFQQLIYSQNIDDRLSSTLSPFSHFAVLAFEIDTAGDQLHLSEKAMNLKHLIGNLYSDYVGNAVTKFYFEDFEGHVVVLHALHSSDDSYYDSEDLTSFMRFVKERLTLDLAIGIGSVYNSIPGIRTTYLEALTALSHRFQTGGNRMIAYASMSSENKTYGFYSAEIHELVVNHLQQNNTEKALEVIATIFNEADSKGFSLEYKNMIYMGLVSLLLSFIVKAGKNLSDVFSEFFYPYSDLGVRSESDKRLYIENLYVQATQYMLRHRDTRSEQIARDAKGIVDQCYSDCELSIADIAKKLLVNQTYLRKMFKDEMGMTLSEYLSKVRMEKAKDLIMEGFYKLSAVSELVGYKDAGYFSKCFKNYFGVSPSDYNFF